jgi:S-adenosylmethionine hydrolase
MRVLLVFLSILFPLATWSQSKALVFQSDFGLKDGAVSAMKGVAYSVDRELSIFDITHEIPVYNIWEAAYRLKQTAPYWPAGTVFVSVVDPGVGTQRKSIVMKSKSGHYFVTPDNGTVTLIAEVLGVEEVREIDESKNRLKNSNESYTFHGRDVYAFTGARLASGIIRFDEVGPILRTDIVKLEYVGAELRDGKIVGTIDILDIQYGNVWTNIGSALLTKLGVKPSDKIRVVVFFRDKKLFDERVVYGKTFGDVKEGQAVAYLNSLLNFSLGINRGSFAERYKIGSGPGWKVVISSE